MDNMDLDTRIAQQMEMTAKDDTSNPTTNGGKHKAPAQPTSPVQTAYPESPLNNSTRRGSLPALRPNRLKSDLPSSVANDLTSSTGSNSRSINSDEEAPARRRSVQFARNVNFDPQADGSSQTPQPTFTEPPRDRRGIGLLTKFKAFTSSGQSNGTLRGPVGQTVGNESIDSRPDLFTPDSESVSPPQSPDYVTPHESDADSEGSGQDYLAPESSLNRRRRNTRRPAESGAQTAPTTPKTPFESDRPHLFSWYSTTPGGERRRTFLRRRATMDDMRSNQEGISEDEGRHRLTDDTHRSRGAELLRGMSHSRFRAAHSRSTSDNARPGTLRRAFTGIIDRHDGEASPWRSRGDRTASLSAAKWKQIKARLRMIGRLGKAQATIDHAKSAELLAELSAGTPAALMLASMFLRDEHGNRRVPVLLEQVKAKVLDDRGDVEKDNRQTSFRMELEYGNGLTRMKWTIDRQYLDFINLHARLKVQRQTQKVKIFKKDDPRGKLPKFPRKSFSRLRGLPGTGFSDSEGEDDAEEQERADNSGPERPITKARQSFQIMRRKSSIPSTPAVYGDIPSTQADRRERQLVKARENLESYIQQTIRYVMFRPESNRLCRFLEISALGVRLAAEDSYHGKEGYLRIITGKGVDFRRTLWDAKLFQSRHDSKWFLVRHSYIVCVDSPEAMNIYDVFLLDADFKLEMRKDQSKGTKAKSKTLRYHVLKLVNSERKLKLLVQHERHMDQWCASINEIITTSPWSKTHRFDSFAPVRTNVFAQWLVDGRDYMWNVSRAISMAKDVIYIHDWWLSPELYMRRPACISKKWRLDRLLQRKAKEGVKIFVIVYRNINSAIPIDSEYTKFSLLDLDSNVFVQRSPNQIRQGTFFWAHHEKLCIVDHMVAFVGGIDLCFGRWDTPQHEVTDDKLTGFEDITVARNADNCQLWPGKDYSNPRVQDFFDLDKPYEEMYDRSKTARMPWHDISMQVVGQPARDLTRHFVQRWNYILRQRKPSRPTPFLLPPPELNAADLEALGLNGTCEVQMLRSCGMWSMGTPNRTEHSIMTAYTFVIQKSEHFVYIENQFFISTCDMDNTRIENTIGQALVERIIRAAEKGENWRAIIVIPLVPGFQNTVDSPDGTSIRLIMQCQYRSICRGESSIFGRLRANGINPDDYIKFFSLRSWGKIGPNKVLTSEQLYIHAKCMVVDDKIAIIGSANINERSMLGNRDSETAAIVRDTDMIWSTMGGQPYLVGRFPHTLRMRLMREHLGIDVDAIMHEEFMRQASDVEIEQGLDDLDTPESKGEESTEEKLQHEEKATRGILLRTESLRSFNAVANEEQTDNPNLQSGKKLTRDPRVTENVAHRRDVEGYGIDHMLSPAQGITRPRASSALSKDTIGDTGGSEVPTKSMHGYSGLPPAPKRMTTAELGLTQVSQLPALPKTDDTDIGGPPVHRPLDKSTKAHPLLSSMKRPEIAQNCMRDPLTNGFYNEIWDNVAQNNTAIFRAVFRCQPDDEVTRWAEYKAYAAYGERFSQSQGGGKSKLAKAQERSGTSGPPGSGPINQLQEMVSSVADATSMGEKVAGLPEKLKERIHPVSRHSEPHIKGSVEDWAADAAAENEKRGEQGLKEKKSIIDVKATLAPQSSNDSARPTSRTQDATPTSIQPTEVGSQVKRDRRVTLTASKRDFRASDDVMDREEALDLLQHIQGHLIIWPYEW